jgi:hypothetical protein
MVFMIFVKAKAREREKVREFLLSFYNHYLIHFYSVGCRNGRYFTLCHIPNL